MMDDAAAVSASTHAPTQPAQPAQPELSIVIPIFNEAETLEGVLARVCALPISKEVIVVNDASGDHTASLLERWAERPEVRVVAHERNRGKGAAVRTGIVSARGTYVIIQDGDLELVPEEIPLLLSVAKEKGADAVYGSRFLAGPVRRVGSFHRYVGNRLLTLLTNLLTDVHLTDMETCYKLVRRDLLKQIPLREDRFGFEPEITMKLAKRRAEIYEVAVTYRPRTRREGKKIGWRDAIHVVRCLLKYRFVD